MHAYQHVSPPQVSLLCTAFVRLVECSEGDYLSISGGMPVRCQQCGRSKFRLLGAEAMEFEEIMGQTADLMDLQRLLNRSADKMTNMQQQDTTRWAGAHPPIPNMLALEPCTFWPTYMRSFCCDFGHFCLHPATPISRHWYHLHPICI